MSKDYKSFDSDTMETFAALTRSGVYHELRQAIEEIKLYRGWSSDLSYVGRAYTHLGRASKGVSVMYDLNHRLAYPAENARSRVARILDSEVATIKRG